MPANEQDEFDIYSDDINYPFWAKFIAVASIFILGMVIGFMFYFG